MMKTLRATSKNRVTSGSQAIQPKRDARQKMKMPETTTLVIQHASVIKTKYAISATLVNKTMSP